MGIHNLAKVIAEHAASAVKEYEMKNLFGVKVAVDASMSLYQFLIAVRQDGNVLTNAEGETTSHLVGLFYRTIRMLEHGVKPVYVFDGKPPTLKRGELAKRTERREEAQANLERAREDGNVEEEQKMIKRLVKVTATHNAEAKQLLRLMGVPVLEAPGEAEAQCAVLTNAGRVFATATDDMDALCFGARILVRHLCASEARKLPIQEFRLEKVLAAMDLSFDSFVDLCILLGCDYCETIRGVGPKKAYELISKHKRLETVFEHLGDSKPSKSKSKKRDSEAAAGASRRFEVPEDYPYEQVRELFRKPLVLQAEEIPEFRWEVPDEEGLVELLVRRFGFAEERVRNGARKLAKLNRTSQQSRIDSFFGAPSSSSAVSKALTTSKVAEQRKPTASSDSENDSGVSKGPTRAKKRRVASSSSESDANGHAEAESKTKTKTDSPSPAKETPVTATRIDENKNGKKDDSPDKKPINVKKLEKSEAEDTKVAVKREEKPRKTVNAFDLLLKGRTGQK